MKFGQVLLLNLALVVVALGAYHLAGAEEVPSAARAQAASTETTSDRPDAEPGVPSVERLTRSARRLAALETGAYALRKEIAQADLTIHTGETPAEYLSEPRLAELQRHVEELRGRRIFERRTANLHIAVKELHLGLTEVERRAVVEMIQASHGAVGAHAQRLREEGTGHLEEQQRRYDEILEGYHEKVRKLVQPAQAEKIIERFMPLR